MKADLKAKWLAALRSGNFTQGRGCLRKDNKYCCLGVLAEVAGLEILGRNTIKDREGEAYLPLDELGAPTHECIRRNDELPKQSFSKIADWLEATLKEVP